MHRLSAWTFLQVAATASLVAVSKFRSIGKGVFTTIAEAEKLK